MVIKTPSGALLIARICPDCQDGIAYHTRDYPASQLREFACVAGHRLWIELPANRPTVVKAAS